MKRQPRNQKIRFAYFAIMMIALGFVATAFTPALLPSFGLFVGGVTGVAGLIFAGNVAQKALTKDVYLKELEKLPDNSTIGTF